MSSTGKLLLLIAVFAAFGLVTTTGAFTTVEAERTATVDVAGDSGALLGLENGTSELIQSSNGKVQITLAGSSATGVNANAVTSVDESKFLNITNNGNQNGVEINMSYSTATNVEVYFVVSGEDVEDSTTGDLSSELSSSLFDPSTKYPISDPDNTVKLGSGDTVSVGIIIDTTGASTGNQIIDSDITITADAP